MTYLLLLLLIIGICLCIGKASMSSDRAIPKVIHKTLIVGDKNIKNVPGGIQKAMDSFKKKNPGYEMRFYNYNDCLEYIYRHYGPKMVDYFERLKPYTYKSDLMRVLLLYNEGGFYSDIKEVCIGSFDKIFPKDMTWFSAEDRPPFHMVTGFIAAPPRHPWIKRMIQLILLNIDDNYYGYSPLYPTGPALFFLACDLKNKKSTDVFGEFITKGRHRIVYKNKPILYTKYDDGKINWKELGGNDYTQMWNDSKVYI